MAETLKLGATLTIAECARLKEHLLGALRGGAPVRLDAGEVRVADTAGLQILIAFLREARERALEVRWADPGETVPKTSALLGLDAELGLGPRDAVHG